MTWIQEILRALLLSIGVFESITNLSFLSRENGLTFARKQHTELPKDISEKNIKIKVVLMLLFGIAFTLISVISYVMHGYLKYVTIGILALFAIYGISEAAYYKYWKTMGFASVTILLLLTSIFC